MALVDTNSSTPDLDIIRISGITATGYHGVLEHERQTGQEFSVDLTLGLNLRAAAADDELDKTVNYAHVAEAVVSVLTGPAVNLIETVAERIAAIVLENALVETVSVTVHKPQAPIPVPFGGVDVTVNRSRSNPPAVSRPFTEVGAAAVASLPSWADVEAESPEADSADPQNTSQELSAEPAIAQDPVDLVDEPAAVELTAEETENDVSNATAQGAEVAEGTETTTGTEAAELETESDAGSDGASEDNAETDASVSGFDSASLGAAAAAALGAASAAVPNVSQSTWLPARPSAQPEGPTLSQLLGGSQDEPLDLSKPLFLNAEPAELPPLPKPFFEGPQANIAVSAGEPDSATSSWTPSSTISAGTPDSSAGEQMAFAEELETLEDPTDRINAVMPSELGEPVASETVVPEAVASEIAEPLVSAEQAAPATFNEMPSAESTALIEPEVAVTEQAEAEPVELEPALSEGNAPTPGVPQEFSSQPALPEADAAESSEEPRLSEAAQQRLEERFAAMMSEHFGIEVSKNKDESAGVDANASEDAHTMEEEIEPIGDDQFEALQQVAHSTATDAEAVPVSSAEFTDDAAPTDQFGPVDATTPVIQPEPTEQVGSFDQTAETGSSATAVIDEPEPWAAAIPVVDVALSAASASTAGESAIHADEPTPSAKPLDLPTAEAFQDDTPTVQFTPVAAVSASPDIDPEMAVDGQNTHTIQPAPHAHHAASADDVTSVGHESQGAPEASEFQVVSADAENDSQGEQTIESSPEAVTMALPITAVEEPFGDLTRGGTAIIEPVRPEHSPVILDEPPANTSMFTTLDQMDEVPEAPVQVVLALGANMGDAQGTLIEAVKALGQTEGLRILKVGPLALTAAVGGVEQDDFYNSVVIAETTMSPRELLHAAQAIENAHLRTREVRWGPRTLDIDIITYGSLVAMADDLELPHPRAKERAFVLVPWSEADPDAILPGLGGGPVAALAATAPDRVGMRWLALNWLT